MEWKAPRMFSHDNRMAVPCWSSRPVLWELNAFSCVKISFSSHKFGLWVKTLYSRALFQSNSSLKKKANAGHRSYDDSSTQQIYFSSELRKFKSFLLLLSNFANHLQYHLKRMVVRDLNEYKLQTFPPNANCKIKTVRVSHESDPEILVQPNSISTKKILSVEQLKEKEAHNLTCTRFWIPNK